MPFAIADEQNLLPSHTVAAVARRDSILMLGFSSSLSLESVVHTHATLDIDLGRADGVLIQSIDFSLVR